MEQSRGSVGTGVSTLDRAVSVLDAVAAGATTFTAIARSTGLPRGTAHRLIHSLDLHGFLAHDRALGYRLGPRMVRFATAALRALPLREVAHPVLERLALQTGESAQLYIRSGDERVCLDAVESAHELRTIVPIGASLPLYAGSAAKVFLASAPDADRFVRQAADRERFARDVALAAGRGWASSADERQRGVGSVSAPVMGPSTLPVAVVSVSGPSSRMSRADARRHARAVMDAAREIERGLGFDPAVSEPSVTERGRRSS